MASTTNEVIIFTNVPGNGGQATLQHHLNINGLKVKPDILFPDAGNFSLVVGDQDSITVQNNGETTATLNLWLWYQYSTDRAYGSTSTTHLNPNPFWVAGSGNNGASDWPIDIVSFGADSTGTRDSLTAINAALALATTLGISVFVPPGVFLISASLAIPSNVTLFGASNSVSTIKGIANAGWSIPGQAMVEMRNVTGATLATICLDMNGTNRSSANYIDNTLGIFGSSNCTVTDVVFKDFSETDQNPTGPALCLAAKSFTTDLGGITANGWGGNFLGACEHNTITRPTFVNNLSLISTYAIRLGSDWDSEYANAAGKAAIALTGLSNASPIVATTAYAHGLPVNTTGAVSINGALGNTAANGSWSFTVLSTTTISLTGSTGNGVYTGGGTLYLTDAFTNHCAFNTITDAVFNGNRFNYGCIEIAGGASRNNHITNTTWISGQGCQLVTCQKGAYNNIVEGVGIASGIVRSALTIAQSVPLQFYSDVGSTPTYPTFGNSFSGLRAINNGSTTNTSEYDNGCAAQFSTNPLFIDCIVQGMNHGAATQDGCAFVVFPHVNGASFQQCITFDIGAVFRCAQSGGGPISKLSINTLRGIGLNRGGVITTSPPLTITGATNTSPIIIAAVNDVPLGQVITLTITNVTGNTATNGLWQATAVDSGHFSLRGSTGNGAYTGGGSAQYMLDIVDIVACDIGTEGTTQPAMTISGNCTRVSLIGGTFTGGTIGLDLGFISGCATGFHVKNPITASVQLESTFAGQLDDNWSDEGPPAQQSLNIIGSAQPPWRAPRRLAAIVAYSGNIVGSQIRTPQSLTPGAGTVNAGTVWESADLNVYGMTSNDIVVAMPPVGLEAGLIWSLVSGSQSFFARIRVANPTSSNIGTIARTWMLSVA